MKGFWGIIHHAMADTLGNFSIALIHIPIRVFGANGTLRGAVQIASLKHHSPFESVTSFSNQNKTGQSILFNA